MTKTGSRVGLGLVLLTLVGGCERHDPAAAAVSKGSAGLHAISGGNVRKAPDAYVQSEMPKVASDGKAAAEGEGGTKAAGSVIAAQADLSLSEVALSNVVELDRQAAAMRLEVRRNASVWTDRGANAQVAGAFDPSDVIAKLQAEKITKAGEIESLKKSKADLDARLSQLRADAKTKLDQANAQLTDYERQRGDIAKLSATEAARVLEATQGLRKQAEMLRLEGDRILAQVSVVEPDAAAKGLEIQQRENQITSVDTAIADLNTRAAAAKAEASEARAAQQKAGEELAKEASALRDFRESKFKDAVESARKTVGSAINTIKAAASDPGAGGKLVLARAQQTLGDLSLTQAQSASQYALLMGHLATAKPALAEASRYADEATKAQDEAKEALEAATKAYEAAQSAYESTPVRGESKERLKKVGEGLGKIAAMAAGKGADAGAAMPEDLRAFIADLAEKAKSGNDGAIVDATHFPTPEMAEAMKKIAEAGKPMARLNAACKAKFGKSLEDAAGGMGMKMQFGVNLADLATADLAALTATVEGDKATIMNAGKPMFQAAKHDGAWKIELPELVAAASAEQLNMDTTMMQAVSGQMSSLADDVEAGKFATIEEVMGAMMQKMQGAMGGMPGGPGAGGSDMNK